MIINLIFVLLFIISFCVTFIAGIKYGDLRFKKKLLKDIYEDHVELDIIEYEEIDVTDDQEIRGFGDSGLN